ncbi:DUF2934 domain-containing protein [Rhizobium sp. S152]|uniref:DUF2934 domain-containing protein n=1 Tax=Rhizobium sp. S152 TaxID=3055038 RepID=UPI0025A98C35|nr:DUF2934 domain-containing protein [Rhizobium sp. S152]MDM9627659.1 DUF2934 domain-containing protein [Rhizobium sp. S152]
MEDLEQQQRERAYKIWEDEGRPEGRDLEHWDRAAEKGRGNDTETAKVTQINQDANDEFNGEHGGRLATDIRPPSTSSAD